MKHIFYKDSTPKSPAALSLTAGGTVLFGAWTLIALLFFMEPELYLAGIISVSISLVLFLVFLFFLILNKRQYSLKYLFLGKGFDAQMKDVLPYFESADETFRRELIKNCKVSYRIFGTVLSTGESIDKSLSRNPEMCAVLTAMVEKLIAVTDDGTGWEGFLSACDAGTFFYQRRNYEDILINDPLDGWEIRCLLFQHVFSPAWRYLVVEIYDICDFTLKDTHVSAEYTQNLEKVKERLAAVYSPMLFRFRDELENVRALLTSAKENS